MSCAARPRRQPCQSRAISGSWSPPCAEEQVVHAEVAVDDRERRGGHPLEQAWRRREVALLQRPDVVGQDVVERLDHGVPAVGAPLLERVRAVRRPDVGHEVEAGVADVVPERGVVLAEPDHPQPGVLEGAPLHLVAEPVVRQVFEQQDEVAAVEVGVVHLRRPRRAARGDVPVEQHLPLVQVEGLGHRPVGVVPRRHLQHDDRRPAPRGVVDVEAFEARHHADALADARATERLHGHVVPARAERGRQPLRCDVIRVPR